MIGAQVPGSFEPSLVRRPRATALGRNTHAVPDVRRLVEDQFHSGFPHRVWVAGQVGQVSSDAEGALRFRLHSSQDDEPFWLPCVVPADTLPSLRETLDRLHDTDVEDLVSEGRLARAGGLLRFDALRGQAVLLVSELDPEVTARGLEEDRQAGLSVVRGAALDSRQRGRSPKVAPLRVGLVRGPDDPAATRVRDRLTSSGYALVVRDLPAPLHGVAAPAAVAQAVREASLVSDLVLLVREQGRPLGLAVFDSEPVARAVAEAPVPVLTGLGGGRGTVADEVAHAALATAEDAAGWVLERLGAAEQALQELEREVAAAEVAASRRAQEALADLAEQTRTAAEEAGPRAAAARRRQWQVWTGLAAVVAVAVVVAALVLATPLLFAALAVPLLGLLAVRVWTRSPLRRRRTMALDNDDFARVLEQLRQVRDQLTTTSSPEQVHRLRDGAGQLVARGEHLLRAHLRSDPTAATVATAAAQPAAPAPTAAVPVAEPASA